LVAISGCRPGIGLGYGIAWTIEPRGVRQPLARRKSELVKVEPPPRPQGRTAIWGSTARVGSGDLRCDPDRPRLSIASVSPMSRGRVHRRGRCASSRFVAIRRPRSGHARSAGCPIGRGDGRSWSQGPTADVARLRTGRRVVVVAAPREGIGRTGPYPVEPSFARTRRVVATDECHGRPFGVARRPRGPRRRCGAHRAGT